MKEKKSENEARVRTRVLLTKEVLKPLLNLTKIAGARALPFWFKSDGIYLRGMNKERTIYIEGRLDKSSLTVYETDTTKEGESDLEDAVFLNVEKISNFEKVAGDEIEIVIREDFKADLRSGNLKVSFGLDNEPDSFSDIKKIELDFKEPFVTFELSNAFRTITKLDENTFFGILFQATENEVALLSENKETGDEIEILLTDAVMIEKKKNESDAPGSNTPIKSNFSLEYLKNVMRHFDKTFKTLMKLSTDYPCEISFFGNLPNIEGRVIIAPRVE